MEFDGFLATQNPETLQALSFEINPELFLDVLLMDIRYTTIQFSANLKRIREADEKKLTSDIKIFENNLESNTDNNEDIVTELEQKKE